MRSIAQLGFAALITAALTACVTAPPVDKPKLGAPSEFKGKMSSTQLGVGPDGVRPTAWLRDLGDPTLNDLLARTTPGNLDLKILAMRMDVARAAVTIASSERWPQVSAGGSFQRQKFAKRSATGLLAQQQAELGEPGLKNPANFWQFGPQVAYEIELWGRIARAREAAQADLRAETQDYDAAAISVTVEVAQSYFSLRFADKRIKLLETRRNDLEKLLRIARERLAVGAADANEVRREAAELSNIIAEIAETQRGRALLENRIATLIGESASSFLVPADPAWSLPQRRNVPAGLPSELLARRPDLRAANERFVAAQARIGEAKAAALPTISLTGSYGYTSDQLRTLVRSSGVGWALAPTISIPIFQGFRNQARVDTAVAQARESALQWQRTALNAFEEVENALSTIEAQQTRIQRAEETLAQLRAIETSLQQQVQIGRRAGLEVIRIRSELLAAEDRVISSKQAELEAQLFLIRALGGDWRA